MTEQNVTVLTAVMNRGEHLLRSLPSWVERDEISEVIIVDWSSSQPVTEILEGYGSSKIHVIRVDGEKQWHLTGAFNTGLRHVTSPQVLRLDADHQLQPHFFSRNVLLPYTFVAGDWRAGGPRDAGLNGFLWAWSDDLFAVGGWDERIRGYGWDDSDLVDRLQGVGLQKRFLARASVKHLPHSARERNRHEGLDEPLPPRVHTQINRVLGVRRSPWRRSDFVSHHDSLREHSGAGRTELDSWIRARIAVFDDVRPFRRRLAKSRHLLTPLLQRAKFRVQRFLDGGQPRRTLILHVRHGLGNRLRALASATLVAKWTGAKLIVSWIPDEHCGAELLDLFDYRGIVISSEQELGVLARDRRTSIINLMDDAEPNYKNRALRLRRRTTLVRASSIIRHVGVSSKEVGRTIALWSPSREVSTIAASIGSGFDLGLHIRQGNYRGALTPSFERPSGNWSSAAEEKLRAARAKTSAESFHDLVRPMIDIGKSSGDIRVYVCADSRDAESNVRAFLMSYGVERITVGGNGADRSRTGVVRALADCIVLASATEFVGSGYSAFSDVVGALRLEFGESRSGPARLQKLASKLR